MSETKSFWSTAVHRRMPQIIGMYIAATWMAVEIGEWISDKLALDANLTLKLFLVMLVLLPSVILVAWNHGAPGKDRWTGLEKLLVPANLLLAVFAVFLLPPPQVGQSAEMVEEKVLVDETGTEQIFEVASGGFHHRVAGFFWDIEGEDASQRWLAYGVPLLLAADLNRGPFIQFSTPYDMFSREAMKPAGEDDGLDLPSALRFQLARERLIPYLLEGRLRREGDAISLLARLFDVRKGELMSQLELSGPSLLPLLDELSREIRQILIKDVPDRSTVNVDLPISEHFSDSMVAIRNYVNARNAQYFDNDYPQALARLEAAVAEDPTFAAAQAMMAFLHRATGNAQDALAALDRALTLDYKLAPEQRFMIKAERYAVVGQTDKAIRVLEMWTEVHPHSAQAHRLLANNLSFVDRLEEAERAYRRLRQLDPSDERVLLALADIQRMTGDFAGAQGNLVRYLEAHPTETDAVTRLAQISTRLGDFDRARQLYEKAAILDSDSFSAELALADLDRRQGEFERAHQALDRLSERSLQDSEQFALGMAQVTLLQTQGRMREALEALEPMGEIARRSLPPLAEIFLVAANKATLQTQLGQIDAAIAALDAVAERVQPPLDGMVDISRLGVYYLGNDQQAHAATLAQAEAFTRQYDFPYLEPVLDMHRAMRAMYSDRFSEAAALLHESREALRRSPMNLADDSMAEHVSIPLAASLRRAGDVGRAREVIEDHLSRYPTDGEARIELARIHRVEGNEAAALQQLDAVVEQWQHADPDYTMLITARELRDEIQAAMID